LHHNDSSIQSFAYPGPLLLCRFVTFGHDGWTDSAVRLRPPRETITAAALTKEGKPMLTKTNPRRPFWHRSFSSPSATEFAALADYDLSVIHLGSGWRWQVTQAGRDVTERQQRRCGEAGGGKGRPRLMGEQLGRRAVAQPPHTFATSP
jgi:hypothetical protein